MKAKNRPSLSALPTTPADGEVDADHSSGLRGLPRPVGEVARGATENLLDAVRHVLRTVVTDHREQVTDRLRVLQGLPVADEFGDELLRREINVTDRPAAGRREFGSDLGHRQHPRPGQRVGRAGVPLVEQHGRHHVADVVGVDPRLAADPGRQSDLPAEHVVEEELFTEVLREPRRPDDGPVGAARLDRMLQFELALVDRELATRAADATAGQQHHPAQPLRGGLLDELAGQFQAGRPHGRCEVRRVDAVDRPRPGALVVPVEVLLARPGSQPVRNATGVELCCDAATGLAFAADDEDRCRCHGSSASRPTRQTIVVWLNSMSERLTHTTIWPPWTSSMICSPAPVLGGLFNLTILDPPWVCTSSRRRRSRGHHPAGPGVVGAGLEPRRERGG